MLVENLIALHRMDGCMPIGAEIATEKSSIRDPLCPGSFASKVYPH